MPSARPTSRTTAPTVSAPAPSCRGWGAGTSSSPTRSPDICRPCWGPRGGARPPRLLAAKGSRTVDWFHRELGKIVWDECGMARSADGLRRALADIPVLEEEFHRDVKVLGRGEEMNPALGEA